MSVSDDRLGRMRAALDKENLAAFCVRDVSNIRWLTAFDGVFDSEQAHALYVDQHLAILHTDSRYQTACEQAAKATSIQIDASRISHAQFAYQHWHKKKTSLGLFGLENSIALSEYRALEREFLPKKDPENLPQALICPSGQFVFAETSNFVLDLRSVKDADEISRMRAAQAITDAAFAHIVDFMKPGVTEREVQLELESFMLRRGAEGLAFSSIVATGVNGANPHAIPGDTPLEAGQCVVLDFGARAKGYCSDMTRTVFLGEPEGRMRDAWETMRRANEEAASFLRPGVTGKEAHELAERVLAEGGFAGCMGHGLGHGVGIDVHEQPVLSPRNATSLVAGNVVTVEPGIYLPGEFGMRLEDFGVITETGFDVFTQSTHELVVL